MKKLSSRESQVQTTICGFHPKSLGLGTHQALTYGGTSNEMSASRAKSATEKYYSSLLEATSRLKLALTETLDRPLVFHKPWTEPNPRQLSNKNFDLIPGLQSWLLSPSFNAPIMDYSAEISSFLRSSKQPRHARSSNMGANRCKRV